MNNPKLQSHHPWYRFNPILMHNDEHVWVLKKLPNPSSPLSVGPFFSLLSWMTGSVRVKPSTEFQTPVQYDGKFTVRVSYWRTIKSTDLEYHK